MVAHDEPHKHRPTVDFFAVEHEFDIAIVVFKVAVVCVSSQVDPLAEIGMPKKTVMLLVRVRVYNGSLDFPTDLANLSDAGVFVYFCTDLDERAVSYESRPFDHRVWKHRNIIADDDWTVLGIKDDAWLDLRSLTDNDLLPVQEMCTFVYRPPNPHLRD